MTEKTLRAAIYIRVSTTGQEDGFSLDTQEDRCRTYAAEHGYEVSEVYREVYTGVELWDRPQLTALREVVRRHEIDAVIAYGIDRLSRDPVHLGVIVSEADHAGVAVLFVTEPLDDSDEGQLIRFVRGYAAKVEYTKIAERTQRGRRARAQSGRLLPGARAPYGYQWRPESQGTLAPNPETAPVLQRIFQDAAIGKTLRAITDSLNAEHVPTPSGVPWWKHATIAHFLKDERYTGKASAYRWVTGKEHGKRTVARTPVEQRIPLPAGVIPALVPSETFAAVQARLQRNRQQSSRNSRTPQLFLLRAGHVTCGLCGRPMTTARTSKDVGLYRCNGLRESTRL